MDWIAEEFVAGKVSDEDYSRQARRLADSWDEVEKLVGQANSANPVEIAAWREREADRIAQEKARKRASQEQARRTRYARPKFKRKRHNRRLYI